ncbi:unnamed protein product [Schistosoma margrebowiei]|uniref:Uncharacterized protein n=1 Tax=Schistosoma margrebowiei TaxID=48269 RepID=A0A183N2M9_9TREM|nr:unnamed protein product [Schistosoma margrebowiei]
MVVGGSRQETLDLGFVLLGARQQGVSVILRDLVLPDEFDPVSPSFTVPSIRTVIPGQPSLNKCRFHSSGSHIAIGDDDGRIHMFDLNETMAIPNADEWTMFSNTIDELRQLAVEQKEDDTDASFGKPTVPPTPVIH